MMFYVRGICCIIMLLLGISSLSFAKSEVQYSANLNECRIIKDDFSKLGTEADFVTFFQFNDFSCKVLPKGGIEVAPENGKSYATTVPPFPAGPPSLLGPSAGGLFDHAKFFALSLVLEAPTDGRDQCFLWRGSGKQLNVAGHPFGSAVVDPETDHRLSHPGFTTLDQETLIINDFVFTNKLIYAYVERFPGLEETFGVYASYGYAIPVMKILPSVDPLEQIHDYKICYNRMKGTVIWSIDEIPVLKINQIGRRLTEENVFVFVNGKMKPLKDPKRFMMLDRGGADQDVSPAGLQPGIILATLMDLYQPYSVNGKPNNVKKKPNSALTLLDSRRFRTPTSDVFLNQNPLRPEGVQEEATFIKGCPLISETEYQACIPGSPWRIYGQGGIFRLYKFQISFEGPK